MLKVLLNQYQNPAATALMRYLPGEVVDQLRLQKLTCEDASRLFVDERAALSQFHYSWIYDVIKQFPSEIHPFLMAVLPDNHVAVLSQLMKLSPSNLQRYPVPGGNYFIHELYQRIEGAQEVVPVDLLPDMPLTRLLEVNRDFLLEMIDLLGIFDLAAKVKQIVNTVELKKITDCLSPLKQKFLRILISKVDNLQMPPIDLTKWNGEAMQLQKIIHRRGLYRLSLVLSAYPPDFVWHLTHRLDTGRAGIIHRYYTEKENTNVSTLSDQILFIMNALTQKSIM